MLLLLGLLKRERIVEVGGQRWLGVQVAGATAACRVAGSARLRLEAQIELLGDGELLALEFDVVHELWTGRGLQAAACRAHQAQAVDWRAAAAAIATTTAAVVAILAAQRWLVVHLLSLFTFAMLLLLLLLGLVWIEAVRRRWTLLLLLQRWRRTRSGHESYTIQNAKRQHTRGYFNSFYSSRRGIMTMKLKNQK